MAGRGEGGREDAGPPTTAGRTAARGGDEVWEELLPGVVRRRMPVWDATVGAVAGPAGVLVVDAGSGPAEGALLREQLLDRFGTPATQVVLTHPHFDHVLGAASFAGARVYGPAGMEACPADTAEELRRDAVAEGMPPEAAAEAADALVLPGQAVTDELTLTVGPYEVVLVNLGPAHSSRDLAVLVRGRREAAGQGCGQRRPGPEVVFCGDLVEESGEPQAGPDAVPALWPAAVDRLLSLGGEDALYVPGHGAVVDAAFVRAQRDVLARRFAQS
ncbi:MBL fold metallo-hydrolase [Streptomyces ovatisporus]|uniref:MBL fold metallo-hydrolase n=1 Tax=Streptomyces ovatisporus TaxID=1128682 RepID=A0ABV9A2M6_9ACTN